MSPLLIFFSKKGEKRPGAKGKPKQAISRRTLNYCNALETLLQAKVLYLLFYLYYNRKICFDGYLHNIFSAALMQQCC